MWGGEFEDDGLNGLVLAANLSGREVTVIRALARYLRQAAVAFSDSYMQRTLIGNPEITRLLVRLFQARFHPATHDAVAAAALTEEAEAAIDAVPSLDEDRILRSFLSVLRAILRTNHYRDGRRPHVPGLQARLRRARSAAGAPATIRDLRLFTAGRGSPPAGLDGGPRADCAGLIARRISAPRSWA